MKKVVLILLFSLSLFLAKDSVQNIAKVSGEVGSKNSLNLGVNPQLI